MNIQARRDTRLASECFRWSSVSLVCLVHAAVLLLLFLKSCIVCHLARQVPSTSHLIMPVSKLYGVFCIEFYAIFVYIITSRLILMAGISVFLQTRTKSPPHRPSEQSAGLFYCQKCRPRTNLLPV